MADIAALARELADCWNRRDWARYRELLHPEYTYMGGDGQIQTGPEAGLAIAQMFATAFPDGKTEVTNVLVAGDTAIMEFVGRGTHQGDQLGIAPTGRRIEIPVCDIQVYRDGKVIAEREYFDMHTMMVQLGVAPAAATA